METLHVAGWTVEPCWLDRDGTGERAWHRVIDPWGGVHWATTSQLQHLLRRHGLDVGELSYALPIGVDDAVDGCE